MVTEKLIWTKVITRLLVRITLAFYYAIKHNLSDGTGASIKKKVLFTPEMLQIVRHFIVYNHF